MDDEKFIKLCEDVASLKAITEAIDKRINGSIDDIEKHISHGVKWRISIIGITVLVIIQIVSFAYAYGLLSGKVEENKNKLTSIGSVKK